MTFLAATVFLATAFLAVATFLPTTFLAAAVFLATVFFATAAFLVAAFFTVATFLPAAWVAALVVFLAAAAFLVTALPAAAFFLATSFFRAAASALAFCLAASSFFLALATVLPTDLAAFSAFLATVFSTLATAFLALATRVPQSLGGALDGLLDRLHCVFGSVGDGLANVGGGFFDVLDGVGHDRHTITVAHVALLRALSIKTGRCYTDIDDRGTGHAPAIASAATPMVYAAVPTIACALQQTPFFSDVPRPSRGVRQAPRVPARRRQPARVVAHCGAGLRGTAQGSAAVSALGDRLRRRANPLPGVSLRPCFRPCRRRPGTPFSWRIYPDRDTLIQLVLP